MKQKLLFLFGRLFVSSFASLFLFAGTAMAAVEVNTADQAALDSIAGVGPTTSRAILDERGKHGNFKDWADLERRVKGIGERNAVKLSAAGLVVNGQQRPAPAAMARSKAEKSDKPEKTEKADKLDKADNANKTEKAGKADKSNKPAEVMRASDTMK